VWGLVQDAPDHKLAIFEISKVIMASILRRSRGKDSRGQVNPWLDPFPDAIRGEAVFSRLLGLERKRSERSGDPFALMLVHIENLVQIGAGTEITKIGVALCLGTRATDIIGWYENHFTLGVIFTGLKGADRNSIKSAILKRVQQALYRHLNFAQVNRIQISFHFYPEERDKTKTAASSDRTLYPDLIKADESSSFYTVVKRTADVLGSLSVLILLLPLLAIIAALVKLSSKGPVLFKQRRLGKFGKGFLFLKFRTMYVDNDPEIHQRYVRELIQQKKDTAEASVDGIYKIKNDARVTPLGRFLRRSSLDELPQFFNVLSGDMALVGPRPPIPYEFECYSTWHRRRVIEVKPGITGLWQVHGRSRTTFDEMVRLDLEYIRKQSLGLDLKILLKTPAAVLSGEGAY
jgi:lipopolysaccharide/colanic/teichoic acid biosynthesis glycosyltransferase